MGNNEKKSKEKKLTPRQSLPKNGCGTLAATALILVKIDSASPKIEFQDMCVLYFNLKTQDKVYLNIVVGLDKAEQCTKNENCSAT